MFSALIRNCQSSCSNARPPVLLGGLFASGHRARVRAEIRCEAGIVFSRNLGHKVAKFQQLHHCQSKRHRDAPNFPTATLSC